MQTLSKLSAIWLLCLLLLFGCKKEETISNTPKIEFVSIAPNPAIKYQDTVSIAIEITDGDGDIGENTPDVKNVFVTDNRNNVVSEFRLPQQAPDGESIIVRAPVNIHLPPQAFVDDSHTSETATYSVYVVDRAGNKSNTIQTATLTINQ
ncbi:MAG: hypothetical protein U0V74_01010 [Chitinophagales bacterium]